MKTKPLFVGKNEIGQRYGDDSVFVFFGNRAFNEEEFGRLFPQWKFFCLKQIHSNLVHFVNPGLNSKTLSGDGMYTDSRDLALTIYTADCIPVMIHDPVSGRVAACHAGWRGLVSNVIGSTLEEMVIKEPTQLRVWIGPHIDLHSFEVDLDVAEQLVNAPQSDSSFIHAHPQVPTKRLVDLEAIAMAQLKYYGLLGTNIQSTGINTLTNKDYYSYRRGDGGRLLNFIVHLG